MHSYLALIQAVNRGRIPVYPDLGNGGRTMLRRFRFLALCAVLAACTRGAVDRPSVSAASTLSQSRALAAGMPGHIASHGLASAGFVSAGFASAPDRGQLLVYPGRQVVRRDGAYTWHRAELSEEHALRAIAGGRLRVVTPQGKVLDVMYDRHEEHPSGDWTWIGHLAGDKGAQTILTFGAQAAFGSIAQPDKPPLRLAMRGGVSWLVETDPAKIAGIVNAATRPQRPDYLVVAKSDLPRTSTATPAQPASAPLGAPAAAANGSAITTIDVVLGYTPGFVSDNGGTTSAAVTRLNYLVDVTNAAYQNSRVNAKVRLVKTLQVDYTDLSSNDSTLEKLTGYKAGVGDVAPDPAFNALRSAREQYGADLVSLVRKFYDPEHDGCGIAWLIGGGQQGIQPGQGWDYLGYSVVSDGTDQGIDGKTYYCRDETLAHELGHNMGSAHDKEAAKGADGVLNPSDYGAYLYSFGYKTTATQGNFYTVMAYGDKGQTGYRVFSNPGLTFCGGYACGIANVTDNARSLNQTSPTVATFRATIVAEPARKVLRDIDGDGRSDFLMHSSSFNRFGWWRMNGAVIQQGVSIASGAGYSPLGTGDFNGDGKGDLMWLRDADRLLLIQVSNGNGFVNVYQGTLAAGWNVVGAADIDGDGRSDVLLHNPTARQFQYWLMDGGIVMSTRTISGVGAGYEIVGHGDVNADGKADLLWTSAARDLYLWLGNGTGFSSARIADYGSGYTVVGLADIDGDGKSDILFHNPGARVFQYRLMQGFSSVGSRSIGGIGSGYSVVAYGDYNGDGKADIAWSSPISRAFYLWLGNGATFTSSYVASYPSGWQPAPPANR